MSKLLSVKAGVAATAIALAMCLFGGMAWGAQAPANASSVTFQASKAEQVITTSKSVYKKTFGDASFKLHAKSSGNGKLTFKSSNKHVVKVTKNGKVKIRNAGSAKIKISAQETTRFKSAEKAVKVKVKRKSLKSAKVKLGRTSYTYNGKAHKPKIIVKSNGHKLKRGSDYKVVYKHNVNAGTALVYVKGTGNYKGTKKATFTVIKPETDAIIGTWHTGGDGTTQISSFLIVEPDGKARRTGVVIQGADYRWEKSDNGTYSFLLDDTKKDNNSSNAFSNQSGVYIDGDGNLHWGDFVFHKYERA